MKNKTIKSVFITHRLRPVPSAGESEPEDRSTEVQTNTDWLGVPEAPLIVLNEEAKEAQQQRLRANIRTVPQSNSDYFVPPTPPVVGKQTES